MGFWMIAWLPSRLNQVRKQAGKTRYVEFSGGPFYLVFPKRELETSYNREPRTIDQSDLAHTFPDAHSPNMLVPRVTLSDTATIAEGRLLSIAILVVSIFSAAGALWIIASFTVFSLWYFDLRGDFGIGAN